jgi:hypothetical protein
MDAGFAIFGIGLFLIFMTNLFVQGPLLLSVALIALALTACGLAFSERPHRREWALGISVAALLLAALSTLSGGRWWMGLALAAASIAFGILWAEYRFPAFGRVPFPADGAPLRGHARPHARPHPVAALRRALHLGRRRQAV